MSYLKGVPTISARALNRPYQNVPFPRHLMAMPQNQVYKRTLRKEPLLSRDESDEIRFAAPPKLVYKKPRAAPPPPPSPMSGPEMTEVKSKFDTTGSDSSTEQPLGYTRDRLLGAVEKVRSGMLLARASPFRHQDGIQSINIFKRFGFFNFLIYSKIGFQTPASLQTPVQTPIDKALLETPEQLLRQRRPTPVKFVEDNEVFADDIQSPTRYRAPHPPSRASMTSMSSGRGSSGHEGSGKTTSISHSRGDFYQDEPQSELQTSSNIIDKTTSSSSGIASRTLSSQLHSSTSPGQSSGISASSTPAAALRFPKEVQSKHELSSYGDRPIIESPQSEPIFPSYAPPMEPLDVSVDENYEFDSISPLEAELIEKLRREQQRWRQWQQQQQQQQYHYQQTQRGPFSDSELYGTIPSRRRYDDKEARCAALKEEFFRFRRRQLLQQQQQQQQSQSSSDEFESAC